MADCSVSAEEVAALLRAAREGDTVAMRDLLDEGVDINGNGAAPLRAG